MKKIKKIILVSMILIMSCLFSISASANVLKYDGKLTSQTTKTNVKVKNSTLTLKKKAAKSKIKTDVKPDQKTKNYIKSGAKITEIQDIVTTTTRKYTKGKKKVKVTKRIVIRTTKKVSYISKQMPDGGTLYAAKMGYSVLGKKANVKVRQLWNSYGLKLKYNDKAQYASSLNWSNRTVTLKYASEYLFLHELGHVLYNEIRRCGWYSKLLTCYSRDKIAMSNIHPGLMISVEEFFAYSYADYVLKNKTFYNSCQTTYKFITSVQNALK